MKNIFGEKRQRFGFRKLSIGLVSAAVASLFFASSVAAAPSASAQSINYSYVTEQELTDAEKELIIRDLPGLAQETDANYYLIYRPATGTASTPSTSTSQVLPNTGSVETGLLVAGGVSLLLLAVRFGKKGKKELAGVILLTATGASFLGPTSSALTSQILAQYNHALEISAGQALPAPAEIDGYVYVGYLKDSKAIEQTTSEGIRTETIVNKTEAIPFEIQTVENPQLSAGTERVVQEGQDGERTVTIKQVYSKGQIISEEEISSTVTKTAVPKIVEVGTKQATNDIVTEVSDTVPSHELPTLQITEEASTYTESIPFETQEVADDTLLEGTRQIVQEGKAGQKTIETKKTYIDGILVKTETVSETINQPAAPQIIHVGTKPVTSVPDSAPSHEVPTISLTEETLTHTEAIAFDVQEIYDANLAEGSREVEQKGQAGVRTIETKNYYADGVLIKSEQVSDVVTKAPVTEVVRVGTKTTDVLGVETVVATEELPFETTVTETEELYVGEEKVVNEGKVGSKEVTTTYQTINGVRQPNPTVIEKVLEEPTTKEVLKGTKPIEGTDSDAETVEIPFETEYVDDPTLLVGKTKVVTTGVNGSKTVTTTYQTIKGVRQENPTVTEEITKQPVKQVIAHGTKVEKVPQVIITDLVENDDAKSATISYKLTDETANFQRAVALLYDNTGALVQDQAITDPNGQLTLENLDFYTDYTVKTKIFYTMAEQEQSSEQEAILESMRKFDLVYKKIEIKDIDAVTVYRRKNGSYIGQEFLEELPTSTDELFIKVISDRFKEVYLPVSSIEETTLNGKAVFKLVSSFDELVQDKNAQYVANREFYIPKMATDANTYTSFKALIDAMKANPKGTFKLGAHLDASEVPVGDVASYVTNFSGTLDGVNDGYAFSISNLKAPLFFNFSGKVQNLDIKNASLITTSKNPLATIAINANNATITNVAVEATIKGPQNVSGLVHSATNTTIKDVSFKGSIEVTGTDASLTGGILGNGTMASVGNAKVDATITLPGTENQVAGGIVGRTMLVYDVPGSVYNSYATGSIVTTESAAIVGGIAGANHVTGAYARFSGNVNNVISDMTGTTSIIGLPDNPTGKIKDDFTTTSDSLSNVTVITDEEAQAKVEAMAIQATIDDSVPLNLNHYSVDYLTLDKAQADHETAYYNMEKILPFYNKELLVYYGNKIATDDKLNKVRLLDVVPMKDNAVVADVYAEKANINKIILHYADGTVDYKTVSYLEDFKNNHVVEYTISGTDLIYTPESFLNDRSALVNDLVSSLSSVVLDSDAMKAVINYPTTLNADTQTGTAKDFYFGESYNQVMANLESNVRKILVASLNGQGQDSEDYIKEKITNNKEAFVLGLTYLNRWYDINFGEMNTKDLTIFEPDFFGNDAASALDMILAIGNGGYDVLRAHNNVSTYVAAIGKQNNKASLFDMVEAYRKLFLPNLSNNDWFKQTTKAYIVESKSQVAEAAAKQDSAEKHSKYALSVYDKITNPAWEYRQMLLPLLTLPQEDILIISNMNTLAVGSYEHYVDDYKDPAKRDSVRQLVDKAAEMQRDNADFWYKILDEENRDKLFRTVLNNEGFLMNGPDGQKVYRNLLADVDAIQDYYGPINKWYAEGGTKTAYANGKETFYVLYNMLDNYGTTLYTHEMVHNQDGSTYLKGYGRRMGQGMEVYADGLLQNVSSVDRTILGFNAVFNSDAANRVHVGDPTARFNSEADFNQYFHNQFDVLYLLDYIEGMIVLEKPNTVKKDWFLKLENYYIQENGKDTHAGNRMTTLTEEDVAKLTTLDDLINGSIIDRYGYQSAKYDQNLQRNGYYSVPMFAGNYSALSNPNGSPGDFMFRRMAFELIAAKGYTDGFIPYASNQLSDYAMSQNSVTYDTWNKKNTGLITDKHVFDHVFNGQYASWEEFKKAMFMERVDKAQAGKLKPFTIQYELGVANSTKEVRIASYDDLQRLIREAIDADIQNKSYGSDKSRLSTLKIKIYQALMNSTNDFRISIFNP
ncbi:YSIRK-type signal peptide-containing protein [Streptococcus suis]|uniref:ZmpA/ZmpB/ZmpC family metallo-endopeptidase n=1 Tax=Streptococcus suis TaxID=1307 RepID=UPI0005CD65FF|nr:ZmpA/ZmpB/ZmpC family metallo-endopeptidase [Streptococcus suis]NQG76676.1 YSIRK-type signal peptide-containing protein [Streptococcus suis]NQH59179.1 YSIRK-type signal peptide-containing protein [Streptococcus suis]NQN46945.1 YSIRK-type signal peptide-containing protein [Streptococcus suis]NQN55095.1 YSIRK-type signal peptide-containing protein [Streptococcus suis]NQN75767.1 YSIRK-type signal peptide-containing protein [Streptococcus suis]